MNTFHDAIRLRRREEPEELELVPGYTDNARGLGLQDLCRAVLEGTEQRASGALGLQVVEVLLGVRASAAEGRAVEIQGTGADLAHVVGGELRERRARSAPTPADAGEAAGDHREARAGQRRRPSPTRRRPGAGRCHHEHEDRRHAPAHARRG